MSIRSDVSFHLEVDKRSEAPVKQQLFQQLRDMLLTGVLPKGTRLPSSRALALELKISRSTVVEVFDLLLADGLTTGLVGSGTYVADAVSEPVPRTDGAPRGDVRLSQRGTRTLAAVSTLPKLDGSMPRTFSVASPLFDEFPIRKWAQHFARIASSRSGSMPESVDAAGYRPLRRAIANRLALTRRMQCSVEQIIIVEGAQHGLDVVAQVLTDEGDVVCVEDPCHARASLAFAATGASIRRMRMDDDGVDVEVAKNGASPRVICVTPSHHFPSGSTLSHERRIALLQWARSTDAWIVEDDSYNEYRYDNKLYSSLHSLDDNERVIYVGSFCATMFAGIGIGYLVVPPALVDAFAAARRVSGASAKPFNQSALASFMDDGEFGRRVAHLRQEYGERRQVLLDSLASQLGGALRITPSSSGTFVFGRLLMPIDDVAIASLARQRGIYVRPVSPLALDARRWQGLALGFGVAGLSEIRAGISTLERCITGAMSG